MRIDGDILTLTQWLSPSFPIGAFAYSHGLEAAIASGWVNDQDSLQAWLSDVLCHGSGRSDAIWIRLAYAAQDAELPALQAEAISFAPASTRLTEGARQGAAFCKTVRDVWGIDLPELLLPLAVGAASRRKSIDADLVVTLYLHAFVGNLVAAAQRLMPLGQTKAQKVLADLQRTCQDVASCSQGSGLGDMESHAFMSDIAAMRHHVLEPRVFQS